MSINQELLEKVVRDMIQENPKFYNTPIKKPTKASTSAASSQKTWNGKENARPSGATQGAYDAIGTPGGVSPTAGMTLRGCWQGRLAASGLGGAAWRGPADD